MDDENPKEVTADAIVTVTVTLIRRDMSTLFGDETVKDVTQIVENGLEDCKEEGGEPVSEVATAKRPAWMKQKKSRYFHELYFSFKIIFSGAKKTKKTSKPAKSSAPKVKSEEIGAPPINEKKKDTSAEKSKTKEQWKDDKQEEDSKDSEESDGDTNENDKSSEDDTHKSNDDDDDQVSYSYLKIR